VRLAGLAAGPTSNASDLRPTNADGGFIGIESGSAATGGAYISGMTPTYLVCSTGILGKYAKQLDTTIDDGNTATGSMRVVSAAHARGGAQHWPPARSRTRTPSLSAWVCKQDGALQN
jgi:hypothetical protein